MTKPRHAHWLTPNHRAHTPVRVIWMDTETDPKPHPEGGESHHLTFGWAKYRRRHRGRKWSQGEWLRFTDPGTWWEWALSKSHPGTSLTVLAHNAAYDHTVLDAWRELPLRGWQLISAVFDSPPFLMTFKRKRRTLRLWDTLNWWRTSLKSIGERVGREKLERPDDWSDVGRDDEYCRRDVEILETATLEWWEFLRKNDLGSVAPTLAAQALTTFRHRYLTDRLLCDSNEASHDLARAAYSGGRVECFRIGRARGPWALYDVRSMYPYVMRQEQYPTGLRSVYRRVDLRELDHLTRTTSIIADVELDTTEAAYPLRVEGYLIFPVGRFRAVLTTPEVRYALERGHIVGTRQVAVYSRARIFKSFVDDLYRLRVEARERGDHMMTWHIRLLMNSLYGKFGQVMRKDVHIGPAPDLNPRVWIEYDLETGESRKLRSFAGQLHELVVGGESWWSHPAIAAHVTAYARLHLWRLIKEAGLRDVAYCDTDSLLVTERGEARLQGQHIGDKLGSLSVEGRTPHVTIHGPKDYDFGFKNRTKGVRPTAKWIGRNTVEQDHWFGLKGLVASGDVSAPRVRRITKHLQRVYRKGKVLPGGRTRPWRLPSEFGAWLP